MREGGRKEEGRKEGRKEEGILTMLFRSCSWKNAAGRGLVNQRVFLETQQRMWDVREPETSGPPSLLSKDPHVCQSV